MSKLASFLVGMGNGYMAARAKTEKNAKDEEERQLRMQTMRTQAENAQIDLDNKRAIATAGEDRGATLNEPGDGMGPSAVVVGKNGMEGARAFAPMQMGQAQEYAAQQNTPAAKEARTMSAIARVDPSKAIDYKQKAVDFARGLEQEGVLDFVRDNFMDAPSLEDVTSGKVKTTPVTGADKFNAVGKAKIPEGAKRQWFAQDLGNGRKVVDFKVVGPKGEPLSGSFTGRTLEGLFGMTAKERESLADGRADRAATQANQDRTFGLQERRLVADEAAAGIRASQEAQERRMRIPDAVKLEIEGIDKQIKAYNDALEQTPATNAIKQELMGKRAAILSQYTPGGGQAAPDPLGLRGKPKSMQGQSAMDESTALSILQNEYGGDPRRAQVDVQSIQSELARKGLNAESRMVLQNQLRVASAAASVGAQAAPRQTTPAPQQTARPPVAGMQSVTKPAAPAPKPTVAQILAEPTKGNAVLDQMAAKKAAPIDAALQSFKAVESQFQAAAKSGDPQAVQAWSTKLQGARAALDSLMKDLPEQTKAAILSIASN